MVKSAKHSLYNELINYNCRFELFTFIRRFETKTMIKKILKKIC